MQLTNENKENLTKKDKKISVNYAFPEYKTYKKENGDEVELTIYEEPRWSFKDKNELFEIIKNLMKIFIMKLNLLLKNIQTESLILIWENLSIILMNSYIFVISQKKLSMKN